MRTHAEGPAGNDPVMPDAVATVHGDTLTLQLTGDIDAFTAPTLLEQAHKIVASGTVRHVDVDLTEVTFSDAAAVRALSRLAAEATDRRASFGMRDARPHIRWLLQQVGAGHLLTEPD
ncbi:STAS domain-containing protein [Actinoplanes sp. NBC_00393]|uniref:STAS domain-containing protein n=1 Tax=Actinoplanes sp. NBC_00393 TaxID=2975953 RepID=UPI002E231E6D